MEKFHFKLLLLPLVCIICSAAPTGFGFTCKEVERNALLKLKHNFQDPRNRLGSWAGEDCCKWKGVGCHNLTGNVIKLDLGPESLGDPFPGFNLAARELVNPNSDRDFSFVVSTVEEISVKSVKQISKNDKWLQLLPKEKRLEEEETEAQETTFAMMARNASYELLEMDAELEDLRELVVQNCRKMSTEEKRQLSSGLARLSTEDLSKALDIVAQANPSFVATAEEVDLDIDAQTETTLWRLKFFVKNALQALGKQSGSAGGNENENKNSNNKRKRELSEALVRTAKKRSKKVGGGAT